MRIIIAEPDTNRQRQLRTILTSLGHKSAEVDTTTDSKSTLSNIRKKRYDLGFFCHTPGTFDGLKLVVDLRGSTSKSLPVVIYSSSMDRETLLQANQCGANGFLAYPFSVSDVENAILTALKRAAD